MHKYQYDFIRFALKSEVLRFGEFTLKSGRISPYFFNAGLFNSGAALHQLGQFYAEALMNANIQYDLLFGPAYKGIPLASATAIALSQDYQKDIPYVFNRKEAKDHGEGGQLVGAPLQGRALIIDDVITAGTAIREVMRIIQASAAAPAGVLIALNRQEKGSGSRSAIQEIEQEYGIPVISIISLQDLIEFLEHEGLHPQALSAITAYREAYGVD